MLKERVHYMNINIILHLSEMKGEKESPQHLFIVLVGVE